VRMRLLREIMAEPDEKKRKRKMIAKAQRQFEGTGYVITSSLERIIEMEQAKLRESEAKRLAPMSTRWHEAEQQRIAEEEERMIQRSNVSDLNAKGRSWATLDQVTSLEGKATSRRSTRGRRTNLSSPSARTTTSSFRTRSWRHQRRDGRRRGWNHAEGVYKSALRKGAKLSKVVRHLAG